MSLALTSIYIYPLKSCAPLACNDAVVEPRGLAHDRRWLAVDANGRMLTARVHARLTLIHAQPDSDGLVLHAPDMRALHVARPLRDARRMRVSIWKDSVDAQCSSLEADAWISKFIGAPCHFVFMDAACSRPVKPTLAQAGDEVSFADGFPLLLICQGSLDLLNTKLAAPVPMLRFRPNLVIDSHVPHAEDGWRRIMIGAITFDLVAPCARCVFTTVDFERGVRDPSGEPLQTLRSYRTVEKGVLFGQNLIARGAGVLRHGDRVLVVA